jgi:hypothetical protein
MTVKPVAIRNAFVVFMKTLPAKPVCESPWRPSFVRHDKRFRPISGSFYRMNGESAIHPVRLR